MLIRGGVGNSDVMLLRSRNCELTKSRLGQDPPSHTHQQHSMAHYDTVHTSNASTVKI